MAPVLPFGTDLSVIAAFVFGLILLLILGRILLMPLRLVWRLVYNGVVGGVMLWLLNLVGGHFGFTIAINPITALVAGFLGIPGVIILVLFKIFWA